MKPSYWIVCLLLLLSACGATQEKGTEKLSAEPTTESGALESEQPLQKQASEAEGSSMVDQTDFNAVAGFVSEALLAKDESSLNELIHPDSGLYFLDHPGAFTAIHRVSKMEEIDKLFPWRDMVSNLGSSEFVFKPEAGKSVKFDCGEMKFNQLGQFVSEKGDCGYLSMVLGFLSGMDPKLCKPSEVTAAKNQETHSREVILTDAVGEDGIIFWLTQIDGKWWFSLYDQARMDCGA